MTPAIKKALPGTVVVRRDGGDPLQRPTWAGTDVATLRPFGETLRQSEGYRDPRLEAKHMAYAEGMQEAKATIDAVVAKYHQGIAELAQLREQICRETEQQLVDLALLIAREVIKSDLSARRAFTTSMVDDVLSMLREAHTITLRLSPADCAAVKKSHPELQSGSSVLRLVEDRASELGGVVAEADLGRIDATVERRLSEVARALTNPAKVSKGELEDDLAQLLATDADAAEAKP